MTKALKNEMGQTLEGVRRQAQAKVRALTGHGATLTLEDAEDAWNVCLDGDAAAEDWMRRQGFDKEADAEFGPAPGTGA